MVEAIFACSTTSREVSEMDFALTYIDATYAAWLLKQIDRVTEIQEEEDQLYCLEFWSENTHWFPELEVPGIDEQLLISTSEMHEVTKELGDALAVNYALRRAGTSVGTVIVTSLTVMWQAVPKHGWEEIKTRTLSVKQLEQLHRRLEDEGRDCKG